MVEVTLDVFGEACDARTRGQVEEEVVLDELLSRTRRVIMGCGEDPYARQFALNQAADAAAEHELPWSRVDKLRAMVTGCFLWAFRPAFIGNSPARVAPMTIRRSPECDSVRTTPQRYPPAKAIWLRKHFGDLKKADMAFRNPQATFSSIAMTVPKRKRFRMVGDHWAVNRLVSQHAIPMPRLKE